MKKLKQIPNIKCRFFQGSILETLYSVIHLNDLFSSSRKIKNGQQESGKRDKLNQIPSCYFSLKLLHMEIISKLLKTKY